MKVPSNPKNIALPGETQESIEKLNYMAGTGGAVQEASELQQQGYVEVIEGQALPSHSNGLSPDAAIRNSPVPLIDRVNLAFGNEKGKLNYLKQRYEDVQKRPDGSLSVKQNGLWFDVDPNGLGERDGWSVTEKLAGTAREAVADILDVTPEALSIGATTLATPAGPAAGIAAAGAANVFNTSLGRLAGTYDATPGEQAVDALWDMGLMAGGYAILGAGKYAKDVAKNKGLLEKFGIKAIGTSPEVGEAAKALQRAAGSDPNSIRSKTIQAIARAGGASDDAATLLATDKEVADIAVGVGKQLKAGASEAEVTQKLLNKTTKTVANAVSHMSDEYFSNINKLNSNILSVSEKAGAAFNFNKNEVINPLLSPLLQAGVIRRGQSGAIEVALNSTDPLIQTQLRASTKGLQEFIQLVNASMSGSGKLQGKAAGEWLTKLNTSYNKLFFEGKNSSHLRELLSSIDKTGSVKAGIDAVINRAPTSVKAAWNSRNSYISSLRQDLERLTGVFLEGTGSAERASFRSQALSLVNQLRSNPDRANEMRQVLINIQNNLYGPSNSILRQGTAANASKALNAITSFRRLNAASEFIRVLPRKPVATAIGAAGAGAAIGGYTAGPEGAAAGALGGALLGPKLSTPANHARAVRILNRFGSKSNIIERLNQHPSTKSVIDLLQKTKAQMYTIGEGKEHLLPVGAGAAMRLLSDVFRDDE